MSSSSSNSRFIAIATVALIASLGLNGYLIYSKVNQDKLISEQNVEMIESAKLKADLEKEYFQALSDLEELRGNNTELNGRIDDLKIDLKTQKERISSLIATEADLKKVRSEMSRMKNTAAEYLNEIQTLKNQNAELNAQNQSLQQQTQVLSTEIQKERQTNDELMTARATLTSEKERLAEEKNALAAKVTIASVVQVTDLDVNGFKLKNSGKETEKNRAKAIDGFKICFNTMENNVVLAGTETFYVRVVNPLGETMGTGANAITLNDGNQVKVTQSFQLDYENQSSAECLNWQPGTDFQPGEYQVELYNKGFVAGQSVLALK